MWFSQANPDKTKTVSWNFGSKEAASMNFISAQLETSPVGIIIDVDDEFRALKNVSLMSVLL